MLNPNVTDLIFRALFSSIFLILGLEHLFRDHLIQDMMPVWLPMPRLFSVLAGILLLSGGLAVLTGFFIRPAAYMLGGFLIIVTGMIHVPAIFQHPPGLAEDWQWLWGVYQQGSVVKNLCLLGVCFHLIHHRPGCYSLDHRRNGLSEERETSSTH